MKAMEHGYKPTIGLEIHAELKTNTKMFCNSRNDPDEKRPNVNICPVCMGHPGTLPVINKEAVKHVLKVGVAVGGELADFTEFDRKNYFYPDIPKGYQISQYKHPLVKGGLIKGVELTRVHLEEDTARNIHTKAGDSLVDFNRAGIPLMELVTEPVIESAEEASRFAKELQLLLRYLGVAEANMEKGEMRVEANISVSKGKKMGTKVEIKNLNSFKSVERGIAYEVDRQAELLERGEEIVQETRGWDENKQETFSQRRKEYSHDYRYFPEPDLPKLKLSEIKEFSKSKLLKELPELPQERRERYKRDYKIKEEDAELFVSDPHLSKFFDSVASELEGKGRLVESAANYTTSDLAGLVGESGGTYADMKIDPTDFAKLIAMTDEGKVSSRGAKDILKIMFERGGNPEVIAKKKDLFQKSDEGELKKIAEKIITENKKVADDYKSGKETALQFLVGQGMKATKGSANPEVLKDVFIKLLK